MITVNGTTYNNENRVSDKATFNMILAALLAVSDLSNIATLKEHVAKDDNGNKTGEVTGLYLTSQIRLPGVTEAKFSGANWYTKHAAFKFDLFNITDSVDAAPATSPKAVAATISADEMANKLAAIRAAAAKKVSTK
jgi:hypothetical protein